MPRPKAVDYIEVGTCAQCRSGTRAPNWTAAEIDRFVELLEQHLPQLKKIDSAWQDPADTLNTQFRDSSAKPLRCVHQLQKKYVELNAKFKATAKKCTGGADTPHWYTAFCRVKDKERSTTVPCPPEPVATLPGPVPGGASADVKPPPPGVTVKLEGTQPANLSAAQLRAAAMRAAAAERTERRRQEINQAKRAQDAVAAWADSRRAAKTVRQTCRMCKGCGLMQLIPSMRVMAPTDDADCTHKGMWFATSVAVEADATPSCPTSAPPITPVSRTTLGTAPSTSATMKGDGRGDDGGSGSESENSLPDQGPLDL